MNYTKPSWCQSAAITPQDDVLTFSYLWKPAREQTGKISRRQGIGLWSALSKVFIARKVETNQPKNYVIVSINFFHQNEKRKEPTNVHFVHSRSKGSEDGPSSAMCYQTNEKDTTNKQNRRGCIIYAACVHPVKTQENLIRHRLVLMTEVIIDVLQRELSVIKSKEWSNQLLVYPKCGDRVNMLTIKCKFNAAKRN